MELTRHQIRQLAFQALFARSFNEAQPVAEILAYVLAESADVPAEEVATSEIPSYLTLLAEGVTEKQPELDELISAHLNKWRLERISKTDLIILRLATFEMLYLDNVPPKVSLNEALELTKEFSGDESRRFVNGVLSSIMHKVDSEKQ